MNDENLNKESEKENSCCCSSTQKTSKLLQKLGIIIALIICIVIVMLAKQKSATKEVKKLKTINETAEISEKTEKSLPRFLDLGADKCMACKAMFPVIDSLNKEYKGNLQVDFIDVWKNEAEAKKYKIKTIPTQIFFNEDGKELYRHMGFISKEDILKKFKEFKVEIKKTNSDN